MFPVLGNSRFSNIRKRPGILIVGEETKIFLQFFKTVILKVFFEFIQKMSEMDLEKALFKSIEEEQVANSDLLEG